MILIGAKINENDEIWAIYNKLKTSRTYLEFTQPVDIACTMGTRLEMKILLITPIIPQELVNIVRFLKNVKIQSQGSLFEKSSINEFYLYIFRHQSRVVSTSRFAIRISIQ